jgi:hypothetical protein
VAGACRRQPSRCRTFLGIRNKQIKVVLASALPSAEAIAIGISEPSGDLVVRTPLD